MNEYQEEPDPIHNKDDFISLERIIENFENKGCILQFKKVNAHSGDPYNDLADQLAKAGANK